MGATAIEWTDATWNPVTGCTKVSAGCDHCYAERITERFQGPGSFEKVVLHPERLEKPLHWRKPRTVFVNSMSDLFHADVPLDFISKVWDVMVRTPQHTYQILTKRPGRARLALGPRGIGFYAKEGAVPCPQPNIWLGVSVEDQDAADARIPVLLDTPAAVRFLSCEPLLGPIVLRDEWLGRCRGCGEFVASFSTDHGRTERWTDTASGHGCDGSEASCLANCPVPIPVPREEFVQCGPADPRVDWMIVGGESGPSARPMQVEWVRQIRDHSVGAAVPFFFKQWGGRTPKANGRELDGRTWDEMPERG